MIRVNIPQEDNNNITVVSPNNTISVNTKNSIVFSEDLSQQWATKMDGKVKNEDFSSKYYAKMSAESAEIAETNANISVSKNNELTSNFEIYNSHIIATATNAENNITQTAETAQNEISTIKQTAKEEINNSAESAKEEINSSVESAKQEINTVATSAKQEITTTKDDVVQTISTTKNSAVTEITQEGQKQIDNIERIGFYMREDKLYFINSEGEEQEFKSGGGGGLELGDIGIAPLGIDETQGKRRLLNGSILVINENTQAFADKVKSAIKLYPSLASTEEQWQATVTKSAFGQCGKFVVDDEAGTIRLPKITGFIQGLTDLASLGELVEAGLPDHTHTQTYYTYGQLAPHGSNTRVCWEGSVKNTVNTGKASQSNSTYGNSPTVQPESIRYPYFIQVATGAETEANITNKIELNIPFFFGMSQYFEVEPNNLSWLKSNGQWNRKADYPDYYDWLLREYNNPSTINVDIVGSLTVNNGVLSGFSTYDHARLPQTFTNTSKPWEFIVPLKISSFGTNQYIFCSESYGFGLNVGADGKLQTYISSNGTSWDINAGGTSTLTLSLNTQYYIKTAWTGSAYVVSVSTDKKSYTTYISHSSTKAMATSLFRFGTGRATAGQSLLTAEIDVKEAELISNGEVWWKGLTSKVKMSTEAYTDYDWVLNTGDETFMLPLLDGSENIISGRYDDLGVDTSKAGWDFVAPANGFVSASVQFTSQSTYFQIRNATKNYHFQTPSTTSSGYQGNLLPVEKGDLYQIYWSTGLIPTRVYWSRFYYAKGNGSLYFYVCDAVQNTHLANVGRIEEKLVNCVTKDSLVNCHVVVETYKNGSSWYRVYSDGWCEQGGIYDYGSFGHAITGSVALLKPYSNTNYTTLVSALKPSNTQVSIVVSSTSVDWFAISFAGNYGASHTQRYASWYACGYIY